MANVGEHRPRAVFRRKSLRDPDDTRQFAHGAGEVVRVGTVDVGRAVLHPGWRWSVDVKPLVRTASCQMRHLHVILSGRFAVQMDDGALYELIADDVADVPPGHDAWVVGGEPAILLDISGNVSDFALPMVLRAPWRPSSCQTLFAQRRQQPPSVSAHGSRCLVSTIERCGVGWIGIAGVK